MQADVILKEPPPWVPPFSLSGGARVEGGGGTRPPPRTPLYRRFKYGKLYQRHLYLRYINVYVIARLLNSVSNTVFWKQGYLKYLFRKQGYLKYIFFRKQGYLKNIFFRKQGYLKNNFSGNRVT